LSIELIMQRDARVRMNFPAEVAESIYGGLRRRHRVTRKFVLYKHQDFQRFEAPHLKMNRGLEQRVPSEPVREFAIVLIV
jgi:hypothetical protein